jgi:hypothetical protein
LRGTADCAANGGLDRLGLILLNQKRKILFSCSFGVDNFASNDTLTLYEPHDMHRDLQQLASAIQAIECRSLTDLGERSPHMPTRWRQIDQALGGGLLRRAVHEWFVADETHGFNKAQIPASAFRSHFPMSILIHLAWRTIDEDASSASRNGLVLWIGSRASHAWPHPRALLRAHPSPSSNLKFEISNFKSQISDETFQRPHLKLKVLNSTSVRQDHHQRTPLLAGAFLPSDIPFDRTLLNRSLFINPPDLASRLWAIDVALRSPAVAMVIADGSRVDMAASRRLQLAAEASVAMALLARPAHELECLSAAATRWLVRPQPHIALHVTSARPRWSVELLRCKGVRPVGVSPHAPSSVGTSAHVLPHALQRWALEWDYATGSVAELTDVADRSASPARAPRNGELSSLQTTRLTA